MSQVSKRRKLSNGSYEATPTKSDEHKSIDPQTGSLEKRRSLFVRSLPASVTTESLTQHFSQSFPLKHATVILDATTKVSRGFGFVTFTDAEDAQAALEQFNGSTLDGRKIRVELAESRQREIEEDITGTRKGTKNLKAEELRAGRQKKIEENQPPKLIIRNLPWSIKTSDDLTKLFMSYGKVKHAVVPKGKGGQLAGFGFVVLRGKKNAENALQGVNGKQVDGRTLAVDWAVSKETWEQAQQEEVQHDGVATNDDSVAEIVNAPPETQSSQMSDDDGSEEVEESEVDEEEAIMNGEDSSVDDQMSDTGEQVQSTKTTDQNSTTIFIRNLPFTADDDSLKQHFGEHFGAVRYARVVYDHDTERSRGTAFVCFFNESDAKECVRNAPKQDALAQFVGKDDKKHKGDFTPRSVLQNESADPTGKYTMEGRVLHVTRALAKEDADRRMHEASAKRDHDKRRLYLLSEGTIPKGTKLYNLLGKTEIDIRESSARQRQKLVKTNPNLGLSLTRLSIRNLPRSVSSKDLKALAREAVVGFARDMKEGKRQPLSKEEISRAIEADKEADRERKQKGKGIVKQVKIVFESEKSGSKVGEGKGGRSRGYGFIEYYGHRNALMGLRWLNGHLVKTQNSDEGRGKRLIVEFAIENAQVVQRRQDREKRYRDAGSRADKQDENAANEPGKRKRPDQDQDQISNKAKKAKTGKDESGTKPALNDEEKNKIAMRNRIIAEKRRKRKTRKAKG